jgi:hypothetical protein
MKVNETQQLKWLRELIASQDDINVTCRLIASERFKNTFSWRWGLRNQHVTQYISMDTSDQQTFPLIEIRYVRGEQN